MARRVAYAGSEFEIAYAVCADGTEPGLVFYNQLEPADKAKVNALFARLGDRGRIESHEKFKKIDADLWEFKSFQIRLLCSFRPGHLVLVTHGFHKKGDKTPQSEIARAHRILHEDAARRQT